MAVYTDINEVELADCLKQYGIGTLLSYKGIAEGVENSNFLLRTTEGTFILTLYEKRVNKDDLPFFLGLMEHLAERGLNCPLPVHRNDGEILSELAGRPAAIITFLEGMWLRRPQAKHCKELGVALANLHLAGKDFEISRKNSLAMEDWRPLWKLSHDQADSVQKGLTAEIDKSLADLEANWPKDLPKGVIHADLFADNVFFIGDELSGLIDFYFACNEMFAYDISICLNAWCFEADGSYNMTKGRALPAFNPFHNAISHINRICIQINFARLFKGVKSFDRCRKLHLIICGFRFAAVQLFFVALIAQDGTPTTWSWITRAGTICVNFNFLHWTTSIHIQMKI
jgi:homoserine kinase type II